MKKILLIIIAASLFLFPSKVFASELEIDWGVPSGNPVFVVNNMLPGDKEEKEISVKNNGSIAHSIAIRGAKTSETKDFSEILDVEIWADSSVIYGNSSDPKKLKGFFEDSLVDDGVPLGSINPGETVKYKIKVNFPFEAGNKYQSAEVVFSLTIGQILDTHLVINEVFYDVDKAHGSDYQSKMCCRLPWFFKFFNPFCCWRREKSDEWVELYNPTSQTYYLRNWSLEDNSGEETVIRIPRSLEPGEFALLSKSLRTWIYWDEPMFTKKIVLIKSIGNGLDDGGDHLHLKNPEGEIIDSVGWGNDTNVWTSDQPSAQEGNSIERTTTGLDTDSPFDWDKNSPPTPGS